MQRWKPKPASGLWIGVALLVVVLGGLGFFTVRLIPTFLQPPQAWPISLFLYAEVLSASLLIVAAAFLLYRVIGGFSLTYEVDRNGIYIRWLGNRTIIPMDEVEMIEQGTPDAKLPWPFLQGIGYYWGVGQTSEGKRLHLFSTLSPNHYYVIHTANNAYAVSPNNPDQFVQHLEQCRRLGAVNPLSESSDYGKFLSYRFWNDMLIRRAIVAALILNLAIFGILMAFYPDLSSMIMLRFNAVSEIVELRPRHQILFLPLAAFGLIVLNTGIGIAIHRQEPTGTRLLQITSVLMQVMFGIAILLVISR